MKHPRFFPPLVCLLGLLGLGGGSFLSAQAVLGELRQKHFETKTPVYPYRQIDSRMDMLFLEHDPVVRTSEGTFVMLWRDRRDSWDDRTLTHYNLFMDTLWEQKLELMHQEELVHLFHQDSLICLVTVDYSNKLDRHQVMVRRYSLATGQDQGMAFLHQTENRNDRQIFWASSPDKQRFTFFHFEHADPRKRINLYYDYVRRDGKTGYKANRVGRVRFSTYDRDLVLLDSGSVTVANKRWSVVDAQPDNAGRIYVTAFGKRGVVHVLQYDPATGQQRALFDKDFGDRQDFADYYFSHLPPRVDGQQRLFLAKSERKAHGRDRGTKAFEVVCFDFAKESMDYSRRLEVSATLRVEVNKAREAVDLRPEKRFDSYRILDLILSPEGDVWLLTQKTMFQQFRVSVYDTFQRYEAIKDMEDMLLFHFGPASSYQGHIFVPTELRMAAGLDRTPIFPALDYDAERDVLRMVMREGSGEKRRGPERIYARIVDLAGKRVSDRMLLYEGRRRRQFLVQAYVEWLNPAIVSLLMMDGEDGRFFQANVNILTAPEEEPEER
jgi:hypothetical protein